MVGVATLLAAGVLTTLAPGPGRSARAGAAVPQATDSSYAVVDAAGGVVTTRLAPGYDGDTLEIPLQKPIVGGAADPHGGYWLVATDGGIFSFGGAPFLGSTGGMHLNQPIVGMAGQLRTVAATGWWPRTEESSPSETHRSTAPPEGSSSSTSPWWAWRVDPATGGYWLVATDGGIFSFNAPFHGSTASLRCNEPVVGMESDLATVAATGSSLRTGASSPTATPPFWDEGSLA